MKAYTLNLKTIAIIGLASASFLAFGMTQNARAQTMLPPYIAGNGIQCTAGTNYMLTMADSGNSTSGSAINCVPSATLTPSGQMGVAQLTVGSSNPVTVTTGNNNGTFINFSNPIQITGSYGYGFGLDVASTIYTGANIIAAGTITSTKYFHQSDMRLKTNIHPVDHALDKILALHGVEFNWKNDGHGDMGVVAQNVAAIFPNVVTTNERGMMSVEYDSLVGPMIEAIRELNDKNVALEKENQDLRAKLVDVDVLKKDIASIHARLDAQSH